MLREKLNVWLGFMWKSCERKTYFIESQKIYDIMAALFFYY